MSDADRLSTYFGYQDINDNIKSKKKLKDKNMLSLLNSLIDQHQEMLDFFKAKEKNKINYLI